MTAYFSLLGEMAIEGWTLVAAAGHRGAYQDCVGPSVNFPALSPLRHRRRGEPGRCIQQVYSKTNIRGTGRGASGSFRANRGGGGGGCSSFANQPPWQLGTGVSCCALPSYSQRWRLELPLTSTGGACLRANFRQTPEVAGSWRAGPLLPRNLPALAQIDSYLSYLRTHGIGCVSGSGSPRVHAPRLVSYRCRQLARTFDAW